MKTHKITLFGSKELIDALWPVLNLKARRTTIVGKQDLWTGEAEKGMEEENRKQFEIPGKFTRSGNPVIIHCSNEWFTTEEV